MRYTSLPGKTSKELEFNKTSFPGYNLLRKSGYVSQLGLGLISMLPLGMRVINNLKKIIHEEMIPLGGEEVLFPMVNPISIWKKCFDNFSNNKPLVKFKDRNGREMIIAPSHDESAIEMMKEWLKNYRDLPVFIYQFQDKYRDELRTRSGLLSSKEFLMNDGYSFHQSTVDLNNFFPRVFSAYTKIFNRCRIPVIPVEAGKSFRGGSKSYEFSMPHNHGKDSIIYCKNCGYKANITVAKGGKEGFNENLKSVSSARVEGATNHINLSKELNVSESRICKIDLFKYEKDKYVMTIIRGDYQLSHEKISQALNIQYVEVCDRSKVSELGYNPDSISPMLSNTKVKILVDESVVISSNLVIPSSEPDQYWLNANFGRDFDADLIDDIVCAKEGHICHNCSANLKEKKSIELAHIYKLENSYSKIMDLSFKKENGELSNPFMGSYSIGMGRLLFAAAESNYDTKGLRWPYELAPFKIYLMGIGKSPQINKYVFQLEQKLGDDVLVDDRSEQAGCKFIDFALLGIPLRIVVAHDFLEEGMLEFYERDTNRKWKVHKDHVLLEISEWKKKRQAGL